MGIGGLRTTVSSNILLLLRFVRHSDMHRSRSSYWVSSFPVSRERTCSIEEREDNRRKGTDEGVSDNQETISNRYRLEIDAGLESATNPHVTMDELGRKRSFNGVI